MSNLRQRNIKSALKSSSNAGAKPSILQKVRFAAEDVIFNRAMRESNAHRIEQMSVWPYIVTFVVFFTFSLYLVDYLHAQDDNTLAYAAEEHHFIFRKLPCSNDYDKKFKGCFPKVCGRAVQDNLLEPREVNELKSMVERGMKHGGGSGGATILDLHTGALSYKDKFVNVYKVTENVFSSSDIKTYVRVKEKILQAIASTFKVDASRLYLTKPTFFSRLTNRTAVTAHDEYWHPHVDKVTYGSFYYTSLLYLTTYGDHFTGGRFMFTDAAQGNTTVEPRAGRLSYFTSGQENAHFVEKVESGTRFAITVSFTCDPKQKIDNPLTS